MSELQWEVIEVLGQPCLCGPDGPVADVPTESELRALAYTLNTQADRIAELEKVVEAADVLAQWVREDSDMACPGTLEALATYDAARAKGETT
ncbi:MAG: hypothetical protein VW239_00235 [Candidatus Nanopelagicales bacterium]